MFLIEKQLASGKAHINAHKQELSRLDFVKHQAQQSVCASMVLMKRQH